MTSGQKKEFDILRWFYPQCVNATEQEIQEYFDWSERGKPINNSRQGNKLMWARIWRGRTIHELWEKGMLEGAFVEKCWNCGTKISWPENKYCPKCKLPVEEPYCSVPYWSLLGGDDGDEITPRYIVDVMKKEMFGGIDAKIIENCYQEILKNKK